MKGNKEAKKPKAEKPKTSPAAVAAAAPKIAKVAAPPKK